MAKGAKGGAVALVAGLLVSCSTLGGNPNHSDDVPTTQVSARGAEITDNFGVADLENRFEDVARQVAPSVVAISATDAKIDSDDALRSNRITPDKLAAILEPVDRTVGTGFVIDADGYIVTNDHVVSASDHIWVTTDDRKVYPAVVVGSDPRADLAVLKIPASHLTVAQFADGAAHRGQWTLALGNPYGLASGGQMALSIGIVSATGRSLPKLSTKEDRLYTDLIQTTAQINPGNSGGPLFDTQGKVIGINSAVILPQKVTNGIGFAIPATPRVREVIAALKEGREVVYGWLGVRVAAPTAQECRAAGLPADTGAKIESIEHGSPAAATKLAVGDIVCSFNGQSITDSDQFVRLVGELPVDHAVNAHVYRDRKQLDISVATVRRAAPSVAVTRQTQRFHWRGMLLGPIPKEWATKPGTHVEAGLEVLSIDPKSPLVHDGVGQGMVITAVAGKPVHDIVELQQIINDTPAESCAISMARTTGQIVSLDP